MLRSMRIRMTFSFVILIAVFGWILTRSISHSAQLQQHYDLHAQQQHIKLALTTFMWILFPAVALGAWIIVGRTLRPLRSLSQQADTSNGTRLVAPSSDHEMVELVTTINGLLDRIEATADAKTQFYAAASHELRTPLQALNGHIDTALSKERTDGEYREALVEAQKQTQRLTNLTRDILTLHQLQAVHVSSDERADIVASVSTTISELGPLIEARNLTVSFEHLDETEFNGRQSFSDVCVRNLIENAVRYSTHGTTISVLLTQESLCIRNQCVLNGGSDMEQYFEPFHSTRTMGGGNGLGLAVCRAAASANGWTITLEHQSGEVIAIVSPSK
jgi:two-component system OmpR family sensor kinase